MGDALAKGRRRSGPGPRPTVGARALMAMQRSAGNSAVNALMAARLRFPGEQARSDIDAGLRELRNDEPAVDPLEKGLRAARDLGIPVDLEGIRPPASALAVTTTGFGPGQVAPKKPVPPPKPVPAKSPLGKAAAKGVKPAAGGPGAAPPVPAISAGPALAPAPAPLSEEQRLEPPVRPSGDQPAGDPAFTQVTKNVKAFAHAKRAHPPAASKAKEAQDAALAPTDDLSGQAKAAKADTMDAQQAGTFDKKAFIASVKTAIEAKSPKTLKEADDYKESGKAGEVKGDVKGLVTQGKEGQARDIEHATAAAPDTSTSVPKPVTPMGPEPPGSVVPIPATGAVPKPAPAEQLNLEAGKHQANQELADGDVTEEQLADSNEPQFEQALADKKDAAAHADAAPVEYRQHEQEVLDQGKTEAAAETKEGVAGMQGAKGAALAQLVAAKGKTKSKDEQKRAEVTAKVQSIFDATEADVKAILDGIDPKVEKEFEDGERVARATFEDYVSAKMSAYKEDRYGGWTGKFRWLRDKIRGMPDKVNEFYVAGRELYLKQMDVTISRVADIVGGDLMAAKKRIATGRGQIATYVKSLPNDLKKVGSEASQEIGERFEQLEGDVASKQESVVDTLASKYVAARKGLDERIEELQAENRGLVDKVVGAIKAIVNTIRDLVAMLKNVLVRVAGVVGQIVKHPVRFLGNLIDGIKSGISKFKDNFVEHLRKGLLTWLFGALAEGGIELPETFDVKGVIHLLASIFGLTWRTIRDRIVKQIGEKAMAAVESGVDIFQKLAAGGVGALWEMLLDKLGDIKEMILDQVKDFVLTRIITAGITWLIGLLNPAAAFIKACKLIYDVVMFFVDNASRIAAFVNTVLDSMADIVRGNISGVAAKIEDTLGQMVPIIIGFLASVIGLGGVGQKVREIVGKLQKPVTKALDLLIKTGLTIAGPVIRGIAGIGRRVKAKVASGKAWVKGKVEAGKQKVLDWAAAIPGAFGFRAAGQGHRVWIEKTGARRVMVASDPTEASLLLDHYAASVEELPDRTAPQRRDCTEARRLVGLSRERLANLQGDVKLLNNVRDMITFKNQLKSRQTRFAEGLMGLFTIVHRYKMTAASAVPEFSGDVRCAASFTVDCDADELPYPTDNGRPAGAIGGPGWESRPARGGRPAAHALESKQSTKTGKVGAYIYQGDTAKVRTERRAEIVTRSTGDISPETHAEARLLEQVTAMVAKDPDWAARVRVIEIHISHSTCPSCAGLLMRLHEMLENDGLRLSIVQWGQLYTGRFPTTRAAVRSLRSKYRVIGAEPTTG